VGKKSIVTEADVRNAPDDAAIRARVEELLADMTLAEKAGQLTQYFSFGLSDDATVGDAP
jgi:beta-glucosidase